MRIIYQLILATGAKNIIEAGTIYGVSTIYLALAVGRNSPNGKVIATEKEPEKVLRAKEHWLEAGVSVDGSCGDQRRRPPRDVAKGCAPD